MLLANVRLDWKVIARYKHSGLFGLIVSNKEKRFYNIGPRSDLQYPDSGCDTTDATASYQPNRQTVSNGRQSQADPSEATNQDRETPGTMFAIIHFLCSL